MDFYEIFVRSPVDGQAAKMISSSDISESIISSDELIYIISRLQRKRILLNKVIGIKTKAQRKNLLYKLNRKVKSYRNAISPRAVDEWVRNGKAIQRITLELKDRRQKKAL